MTINTTVTPDKGKDQPRSALLASQDPVTLSDYIQGYIRRVRSGDIGALPVFLGLAMLVIVFSLLDDSFLTAGNFVSLIAQMAGITFIAYGVIFVLLLGEIDLSIGFVSGVAGVLMAVLLKPGANNPNWPWYLAMAFALFTTAGIGTLHGLIITFFNLPSFVVTLAGFLAWSGVVLLLAGEGGTITIQDRTALGFVNSYLPPALGWILAIAVVAFYFGTQIVQIRSRQQQGLSTRPLSIVAIQTAIFGAIMAGVVYVCNRDRGVPVIGIGMIVLLVVLTYITERTRFGRYVYAVGGSREAARRAGIKVEQIRIWVFMISSLFAGLGGIILSLRLRSVSAQAGRGDTLLYSIAAAVIGGTSLFGGRGKVSSAILGALVIAVVENGMFLLGLPAGVRYIVTGLVLLLAVVIDALARRSQKKSGLA